MVDENIIRLIQQAQQRIVFIAPGISGAVAKALGERLHEQGQMSFTVILDADHEVCRLGLGSLEGLTLLKGYCFSVSYPDVEMNQIFILLSTDCRGYTVFIN